MAEAGDKGANAPKKAAKTIILQNLPVLPDIYLEATLEAKDRDSKFTFDATTDVAAVRVEFELIKAHQEAFTKILNVLSERRKLVAAGLTKAQRSQAGARRGKPSEGEERIFPNGKMLFTSGRWYPVGDGKD